MIIGINESSVKEQDWSASKRLSRSVHPSIITICRESLQPCRGLGKLLLGHFPSWWADAHSPHYELCLDSVDDLFGKAQYYPLLIFSCGKSIQKVILELAKSIQRATLNLILEPWVCQSQFCRYFACIFGKQNQDLFLFLHAKISVKTMGTMHALVSLH